MWCPAPLPEREQHQRKLRSDKYKPPAGCLLEFYESDSSVEADEDTGDEAEDGNAGAAPDAGGAAKARRRTTRSEQSIFAAPAAVSVSMPQKRRRRGRGGWAPLRRWSLHRFRHLVRGRLSQKRRRSRRRRKLR
jgi:hypothetical protein